MPMKALLGLPSLASRGKAVVKAAARLPYEALHGEFDRRPH